MKMKYVKNWSDHLAIYVLALVTLMLRLYFPEDFTLSNDELSAIIRTQFENFSDVIRYGVVATDPHPAGVQVFMFYYIKWFGNSAWIIRLPFVFAGVLSLFPFYYAVRTWTNSRVATLASSFLAFSILFMHFGQIARPYAFGLFFVMSLFYSWTKYYFHHSPLPMLHWFGMILFSALSLYTHYFAALMAFIIGVTAFFSARSIKRRWVGLYGIIVLLLYLPHYSIFATQTSREDITGWLPMPEWTFVVDHVFALLNHSIFLLAIVAMAIFLGRFVKNESVITDRIKWISMGWFLAPIVIAYLYSSIKGAVLMDRVLLFSAPFFFLLISIWISKNKYKWIPALVFAALISDTFIVNRYYDNPFTENLKSIAFHMDEKDSEIDAASMLRIGNFNDIRYVQLYRKSSNNKKTIDKMNINKADSLYRLIDLIEASNADFVETSYACVNQPYEVPEIIKMYFPQTIEHYQYYNSGYSFFGKSKVSRDTLLWDRLSTTDTLFLDGSQNYVLTKRYPIDSLLQKGMDAITFSCHFKNGASDEGGIALVISFIDPSGDNEWYGRSLSKFKQKGDYNLALITRKLPTDMSVSSQMVVYFLNNQNEQMEVVNPVISSFSDSHYDFYPF